MNFTVKVVNRGRKAMARIKDDKRRRALVAQPRPLRQMPAAPDASSKVLVVVAHPDDEAIAAGILLRRSAAAGVVCVTNGAPENERFALAAGYDNWLDYAQARHEETKAAVSLLQRPVEPLMNLGVRDQQAAQHLVALSLWLARRVAEGDFTHVVTHAYEGGHPDHDSVAFAVHAACALVAKAGGMPPALWEAALYSAPEGGFVHQVFVAHEDAGPAFTLNLTPAEQDLKRRMFGCYVTQTATFEDFSVEQETFRPAPRYHFTAPPHPGAVAYERFGWLLTGDRWRKQAWCAIRKLDLIEPLA